VDEQHLLALKPALDRFLDRFAPLCGRNENQTHARRFVPGWLHGGERRHAENSAPAMSGGPARSPHALISTGVGPEDAILTTTRGSVLEVLAEDDAVWNSDETGFPQKGTKSVGVPRQYSGTRGRTDHCQVAVFANSSSARGHPFTDRRLFLPAEWAGDRDRRDEAGVPAGVLCRTKPELALEMVANAVAEGVPCRWVGGAGVHGDSPTLARGVRPFGKWSVLDSAADARVRLKEPRLIPPEERPRSGRGRRCTQPLVVGEARRVDAVVLGQEPELHATPSLLALAFLVLQRVRLGEKRAADERARGARPAGSSAGGPRLGRGGDPHLV
jgi:DDE superfamily endonuclease